MSRTPINLSYAERNPTVDLGSVNPVPQNSTLSFVDTNTSKQRTYTFSDINLNAGKSGKLDIKDRESIMQSIWLIIGVPVLTRWWRPEYGTNLESLLFMPMDEVTANQIETTIYSGLTGKQGDPRLTLKKVEVIPDYENEQYYVNIKVDVPQLGLVSEDIEFGLRRL